MIELLLQADRLLTVDMVDQADAIYRKVAEADPHNAIAVVGMARCALARGDDHEAYRLADRALRIDPQNDMARRMEARLHEVLTVRGEVPGQHVAPVTPAPAPAGVTSQPAQPVADSPAPTPAPPVATPAQPAPAPPSATGPPVPGSPAAPAPSVAPAERPAPAASRRTLLDRLRGR